MALELLENVTVQTGLAELKDKACSMKQNMLTRVKTPVLEDGTSLWKKYLDSKDVNFYGSTNDDNKYRFKIYHGFDLTKIVNAKLVDGAVPSEKKDYMASKGTEFIILDGNHAIRADKYEGIKKKLNQEDYSLDSLEDGIFKINTSSNPDEIIKYDKSRNIEDLTLDDIEYVHGGWLEHAVGKNNASQEEYLEAAKLLAKYVIKAQEKDCFEEEIGMGFFVETDVDDYKLRPWYVGDSDDRSVADVRDGFGNCGRFLRAAAQKIDYRSLASTLKSSEFDPEQLGNELDPKSLQNMALAQAAYVARQQKQ